MKKSARRDVCLGENVIHYETANERGKYVFKICLQKCVCWRRLHNMLETKFIKSGGKSRLSLLFLASIVNDVTRKLYKVGIHLSVGKQAKRILDTTVETTSLLHKLEGYTFETKYRLSKDRSCWASKTS